MIEPVRPQDASGVYRRHGAQQADAAAEHAPGARVRNGRGVRSDQITLSEQAQDLRSALAAVEAQPETRAQLIAALRRQLDDGTYRVDARVIAQRMLAEGSDA